MGLGFILGNASKDHQQKDFEQLAKWRKENPNRMVYYIVPNHIKFESEVNALKYMRQIFSQDEKIFAAHDLQVFSFTRLAWYFMKDMPAYQIPRISSAGSNMIIYRILRDLKDELQVFSGEESQPGFITQLAKQMTELQNGCIMPEDVMQMAEKLPKESLGSKALLRSKLHDLALVYTRFIEMTSGRYLANTEILTELTQYLEKIDLQNSCFLISGFNQMTAREMLLVEKLIKNAESVVVDLVLNHPYVDEPPKSGDLFYRAGNLYYQLYAHAHKSKSPVMLDTYAKKTRVSQDLCNLEDYWIDSVAGFSAKKKQRLKMIRSKSMVPKRGRKKSGLLRQKFAKWLPLKAIDTRIF